MKKELKKLHLHLFDGEGGDGGAAGSFGSEAAGTEETTATVVYGKSETEGNAGQVGTDETGGNETDEGTTPEAEFAELIKGKYKDAFTGEVNKIMDRRFRNTENYQDTIKQYDKAISPLYAIYGIRPGNIEALQNAISNDEDLYSNRAEEAGMTPAAYKEHLRLTLDAQEGRSLREEMQRELDRRQQFEKWDREAAELKQAFPSFDLAKEVENEAFVERLQNGYSVRDAFMVAHMEDIMSGAMGEAKSTATRDVVSNIQARQARPAENAATKQPAVIRKTDPSKWTDEDFEEVERRVRNGERIVL